jgi:uncharacterized glyoxalase superfamily protein PhnB
MCAATTSISIALSRLRSGGGVRISTSNGEAEKAIRLYENALGAKVENVSRFGDVPGMTPPAEHKNRVIHACFTSAAGW